LKRRASGGALQTPIVEEVGYQDGATLKGPHQWEVPPRYTRAGRPVQPNVVGEGLYIGRTRSPVSMALSSRSTRLWKSNPNKKMAPFLGPRFKRLRLG